MSDGFLHETPLDLGRLIAQVQAPERGGVASFLGLVRDHHGGRAVRGLSYRAYAPMAEAIAAEILSEAETRWPVRVAAAHRLGDLVPGDAAVAAVAAGAHRPEAFAACRFLIEEIKRRVPVWKLEKYADGSEAWVDPTVGGMTGGVSAFPTMAPPPVAGGAP